MEGLKKGKYEYMGKEGEGGDVLVGDRGYVVEMGEMELKEMKLDFRSEL